MGQHRLIGVGLAADCCNCRPIPKNLPAQSVRHLTTRHPKTVKLEMRPWRIPTNFKNVVTCKLQELRSPDQHLCIQASSSLDKTCHHYWLQMTATFKQTSQRQWRNNRACKACSARGKRVNPNPNPEWGRGGPFGILARGPTATLLRHCSV